MRPLKEEDYDALFKVASDPLLWEQHPANDRYKEDVFKKLFQQSLQSGGCLIAVENATNEVIGSSRYNGLNERESEIEIGWSFLARRCWGGIYNKEMKKLMLEHAFKFVKTVVFLIGEDNMRSRKAIEKIGGIKSGTRKDSSGNESLIYKLTKVPA